MAATWLHSEFEAIFREHFERIVRITRRVLHSDAEAEEICSDTFLKLYRSGPGVLGGAPVGAWLYRVATRAAIDSLRRSNRRGIEQEVESETGHDRLDDPLDRLIRTERIAQVRSALAELKPEKAQLLLLRHSGLSYQEIAAALELNPGSVGTMLARAEAEFAVHYERGQRLGRQAAHLQTAKEG